MYHPITSPDEPSSVPETPLSSSHRVAADTTFAAYLGPFDQHAYPTLQNGFSDPRFRVAEPNLAARGSSLLFSTAHIPTPPTSCFTWNNALSGDVGPSASLPVPGQSESSAHRTQEVSGDSAVAADQLVTPHEQERKIRGVFLSTTAPAFTGGQPIPHPEHVVLWYLMCWNAVIVNGPRQFVPQTIYVPQSQGDRERYVSLANLQPPIIFLSQDSLEWGIPITQLLSKQLTPLVDGDKPAFTLCGPSMGIRVQWPGYQPCHKQVSTRDYTGERRIITKAKLAQVVARCVKQFMDGMSEQPMQVGSDRRWRVGPLDVQVDDITLVSLHHVSQGSWQPQLRLRRVIRTGTNAGGQSHRTSMQGQRS